MTIETRSVHITPAGGNVFLDLGFSANEAAALKATSGRLIAQHLAVREALVEALADWVAMTRPADAAGILGITHAHVATLLRKNHAAFSIEALMTMLMRAGKRVDVCVREVPQETVSR